MNKHIAVIFSPNIDRSYLNLYNLVIAIFYYLDNFIEKKLLFISIIDDVIVLNSPLSQHQIACRKFLFPILVKHFFDKTQNDLSSLCEVSM